jgi:V/A-type H+-transporting ATPase subunit F
MNRIVVLTPAEAGCGFALTGVHQQTVSAAEAWPVLQAICADPAVGVVAVEARLLATLDQRHLAELTRRWAGVLVTLPAPAGAVRSDLDDLQRLVRRALGYHVRIES